ncbi:MAG: hypothetical protein U1F43_32520 [Myxococcota bacterium]
MSSITYTNAGRIGSIVHANGVSDAFAYDALLRHAGSTSTGPNGKLLDTVVSRDRKGNIAAETDAITAVGRSRGSAGLGGGHPSRAAEYSYDAYDRVVGAPLGASGDTETLSYAYDASDNLTARTSSRSSSPANAGPSPTARATPAPTP